MKAISAIFLSLTLQSPAKEPIPILTPSLSWADSLPQLMEKRSALVLETALQTQLRAYARPGPKNLSFTEPEILAQAGEMLKTLPAEELVDLKIELLSTEKPTAFSRSIQPAKGVIESICRVGGAKITRSVVWDEESDTIMVHLLADKPGALSFRVNLGAHGANPPKITNRKELIAPPGDKPNGFGAHVWVIPFESDVTPDGNAIIVRGEGEAVILLSYAAGAPAPSDALTRLGNRYDPGHNPPDPIKIWRGVLESKMKSVENSP